MDFEQWKAEIAAEAREVMPVLLPLEAITLIEPAVGEVTAPLQKCVWNPLAREGIPESSWSGSLDETDRSLPRAVRFSWNPVQLGGAEVRYDFEVRLADGASSEKVMLRGLSEPNAEVTNLRVGAPYRWKVRARSGKQVISESPVGSFTTHPAAPRWIHVPGITNVRDVGGWKLWSGRRVRQGLLFRGSEMNSHCTITDEGRQVLMDSLGIRTDLDLRGVGEDRMPVLDAARVEYINIPLASYDMIASPEYTGRYRALFGILAMRRIYPAYIHCWGGADRTGTVAFLLGALLGMSLEDLITDYELTSLSIWGTRKGSSEAFQEMLETLELFAERGSSLQTQVQRYLRVIGVTETEITTLKDIFTE